MLAELDASIADARAAISTLKTAERGLRSRLSALAAAATLPELRRAAETLRAKKTELTARLGGLKAGTGRKVGKREREETEEEWKMWKSRAGRRKRAFNELWGAVGEALPEGVKGGRELWVSGPSTDRGARSPDPN